MNVLFVCSGNKSNGISPIVKAQGDSLIKAGVNIEYFLIGGKGMAGYIRSLFRLREWLGRNRTDLLHAHYGLSGWVAYLAKPKKIPLILSYMGSDISGQQLISRLNLALQNKADHVIVKSKNLLNRLSRTTGVSVIPNGVDLKRFFPRPKEEIRSKLNLDVESKIILFLGNPDDCNKNFALVESAVNLLPIKKTLLLTPYPLAADQVPLYLNAADVLVLASRSEGSPNVIKEAMACNCPVVATDVGDIRWILGDTPGCHISDFTPEDMYKKIKYSFDSGKRTKGRERIMELGLDNDSVARKIISLYLDKIKLH